jgi:hypothetical protein
MLDAAELVAHSATESQDQQVRISSSPILRHFMCNAYAKEGRKVRILTPILFSWFPDVYWACWRQSSVKEIS